MPVLLRSASRDKRRSVTFNPKLDYFYFTPDEHEDTETESKYPEAMSETQKNGSANENGQGTTKAVPWTELDRAIVLNNILGQLHASSGKSLDWKAISEALPGRTMASMRAVWDRYRNDMKTAAVGEGELVAVPNKQKTPRKKSTPKTAAAVASEDADAEDVPETPAKKRGGGAKKRASGADGEEGSATKKKRTPKKTPAKKTAAKVEEEEEEASEEAEPPAPAAANVEDAKNSDEDMKDTAEAEV
ncbi:hypothetical protein HYQ46_000809 [Verticillium longisporum]|nr:hypothetical protein HYQ46_000809 [Verticillium longisporum]